MLYTPKTSIVRSVSRNLLGGENLTDEGLCLVAAQGGTVKRGTGSASEIFVGFSVFQRAPIESVPFFANGTAGADLKIVVPHAPLAGTLTVRNASSRAAVAVGTGTGEYQYDAATRTITVGSALQGIALEITGTYSPTMMEVRNLQGNVQPGGTVPANYGLVGCLSQGDIYTTCYNPAIDWSLPNLDLRVGANGVVTAGGTGAKINGWVISVPNGSNQYLGISLLP